MLVLEARDDDGRVVATVVTSRCFVGDIDYHRDGVVSSTGLDSTAGYHVTVDIFEQVGRFVVRGDFSEAQ